MIKKITLCQENHLCDLFREGLKALSLSKDEAGEIIKAGAKMQEQFRPILQRLAITKTQRLDIKSCEILPTLMIILYIIFLPLKGLSKILILLYHLFKLFC